MISEFINHILNSKLRKKKEEVTKLRWQKAQLEVLLSKLEREHNINREATES